MSLDLNSVMRTLAAGPVTFSDHSNKHITDKAAAQAFMNYVFKRIAAGDYPKCTTWIAQGGKFYDISLEGFLGEYTGNFKTSSFDNTGSGGVWIGFSKSGSGIVVNH